MFRAEIGMFFKIFCTISKKGYNSFTQLKLSVPHLGKSIQLLRSLTCTWFSKEGRKDLCKSNMIRNAVSEFSSLSTISTFNDNFSISNTHGFKTSELGKRLNISKMICRHLFSEFSLNCGFSLVRIRSRRMGKIFCKNTLKSDV